MKRPWSFMADPKECTSGHSKSIPKRAPQDEPQRARAFYARPTATRSALDEGKAHATETGAPCVQHRERQIPLRQEFERNGINRTREGNPIQRPKRRKAVACHVSHDTEHSERNLSLKHGTCTGTSARAQFAPPIRRNHVYGSPPKSSEGSPILTQDEAAPRTLGGGTRECRYTAWGIGV